MYPPSKLCGASLGVGLGEEETPLPQPRSFRCPRPAAAHLRDGGGAGDQSRRPSAVEGGGRGEGPAGGRPGLCWGRLGPLVSASEEKGEKRQVESLNFN